MILFIVPILAAIAIPNFVQYRMKAYDASTRSAGRSAKLAEESYYYDKNVSGGTYSDDLSELLKIDPRLTEDPEVTFVFSHAGQDSFTFYTTHAQGSGEKFTYTD